MKQNNTTNNNVISKPNIVLFDWSETLFHFDPKGDPIIATGAIDFINKLKQDGIGVGVISNSPAQKINAMMEKLHVDKMFDIVVPKGVAPADKPSAQHIEYAVTVIKRKKGIPDEQDTIVWYIGDTDIDVHCALAANAVPILFGSFFLDRFIKSTLKDKNLPYIAVQNFLQLYNEYADITKKS